MSDEYTLKAPLFKWFFSYGSPPYTLNPLWARFVTTEADWPTLCGDGQHRNYYGAYCVTGDKKGFIYVNPSSAYEPADGFKPGERLLGWLDKSDGYFKLKVPRGGLPLEPCSVCYGNLFSGIKKGVRYNYPDGSPAMPFITLTPYGAAFWRSEYGDFLWAKVGNNGWENGGRFTLFNQEMTGYDSQGRPIFKYTLAGAPYYGSYAYWTTQQMFWTCRNKDPNGGISQGTQIEWWQTGINGSSDLVRGYMEVPQQKLLFYTRYPGPTEFAYMGTANTPWLTINQGRTGELTARQCFYNVGNNVYSCWQLENGKILDVGFVEYFADSGRIWKPQYGPKPDSQWQGYTYVENQWMITGAYWSYEPQDFHPAASYLTYRGTYNYILVYAWEIISEEIGYVRNVTVLDRYTGDKIVSWNVIDSPYQDPTVLFVSGQPLVFRETTNPREPVCMNIATGSETFYRRHYLYNSIGMNLSLDESYHWDFRQSSAIPYVFRGDCLLLSDPGDPYMIIHESSFTDLSHSCPAGSYRGEARYVITTLVDKNPVPNAQVTCRIVGETIGTHAQVHFDQTVSQSTAQDGSVIFHSGACIAGDEPFLLSFSVLNVVAPDKTYLPASNSAPATVYQQYGEEAPPPSSISPDPSEFHSSSPFQMFQSATYYHVMAAAAVTTVPANEPVEYKFTCVDNGSISSTWRNDDNVAGKFNPNGTPQTPQQYWVQVGIKNLMYRWKVQYRLKNNPSIIAAESPQKQITNVLP